MKQHIKKYLSSFLLAVWCFAAVPAPLFHEIFAHHTDAADNHCRYFHKDLGRHVEEQQDHCDIFKANTPLYDAVKITLDIVRHDQVISLHRSESVSSLSLSAQTLLPSRAPPIA